MKELFKALRDELREEWRYAIVGIPLGILAFLYMSNSAFAYTFEGVYGTYPTTYYVGETTNTFDFQEHYNENKSKYPNLTYVFVDGANGVDYMYRSNEGFYTVYSDPDDADWVSLRVKNGGSVDSFSWDSSAGMWKYRESWTPSGSVKGAYYYYFGWTSDTLYTDDGTLFLNRDENFLTPPTPLAEVIQGVTEATLTTETLPALGGTMKTLVLCGVGLIALLAVLKLFGKRSLIFRN